MIRLRRKNNQRKAAAQAALAARRQKDARKAQRALAKLSSTCLRLSQQLRSATVSVEDLIRIGVEIKQVKAAARAARAEAAAAAAQWESDHKQEMREADNLYSQKVRWANKT